MCFSYVAYSKKDRESGIWRTYVVNKKSVQNFSKHQGKKHEWYERRKEDIRPNKPILIETCKDVNWIELS
jgi:hypothetical protein